MGFPKAHFDRGHSTLPLRCLLAGFLIGSFATNTRAGYRQEPRAQVVGLRMIEVATEAEAEELRSRIERGASFDELARARSLGPNASSGGYMGSVVLDDLRDELRVALSGLGPGELSPIIEHETTYTFYQSLTEDEEAWLLSMRDGQRALNRGLYAEAEHRYRAAVGIAEGLGDRFSLARSLSDLALLFQVQRDDSQARVLLERSMDVFWRDSSPSPDAGIGEVLSGFTDLLSRAASNDLERARVLGRYIEAVRSGSPGMDLLVAMSVLLEGEELTPQAAQVLEVAVERFPDSLILRRRLGNLYVKAGRVRQALRVFEQVDVDPGTSDDASDRDEQARIHRRRGDLYVHLGLYEAALSAYRASLGIDPNSKDGRLRLGFVHFLENDFEAALGEYHRALDAGPATVEAHYRIAQAQLGQGSLAEAERAARDALDIDPGHKEALYILGTALIRMGRPEQGRAALADFRALESAAADEERNRRDRTSLYERAATELSAGRWEPALDILETAVSAYPEASVFLLNLGATELRLGRYAAARDTFQKMFDERLSDHFLLHWYLARTYEALDQAGEAMRYRATYLRRLDAYLRAALD